MEKTLWVAAHNTVSGGADPIYARVRVTPELVTRILAVAALVVAHGLTEARISGAPESWGPEGEDTLSEFSSGTCPEIVVTRNQFWFTDSLKHEDGHIQTVGLDVAVLQAFLDGPQAHAFLGRTALYNLIRDCGDTLLPARASTATLGQGSLTEGLDEQQRPLVKTVASNGSYVPWEIQCDLTDRWGELNEFNAGAKPALMELTQDPGLLNRLREQMSDEITFVTYKDGRYGVLYEIECCCQESEEDWQGDPLPARSELEAKILAALAELESRFPNVEFASPHPALVIETRNALWAFAPDGSLDAEQRRALSAALLAF